MEITGITSPGDDAVRTVANASRNTGGSAPALPSSSGGTKEISKLAERLSELNQTSFQIVKHPASGMIVVRIIDQKTGQIVREVPSEDVLDCVSDLLTQAGLLLDRSA